MFDNKMLKNKCGSKMEKPWNGEYFITSNFMVYSHEDG